MRLQTLFLAATLVASSTSAFAAPFSELIVFGDSLSDNGNLSILAQTPPGHRRAGAALRPRSGVSNGPVAVDYLAASLGLARCSRRSLAGNNYAVIGAATGEVPIPGGRRGDGRQQHRSAARPAVARRTPGCVSQVGLFLQYAGRPARPQCAVLHLGRAPTTSSSTRRIRRSRRRPWPTSLARWMRCTARARVGSWYRTFPTSSPHPGWRRRAATGDGDFQRRCSRTS